MSTNAVLVKKKDRKRTNILCLFLLVGNVFLKLSLRTRGVSLRGYCYFERKYIPHNMQDSYLRPLVTHGRLVCIFAFGENNCVAAVQPTATRSTELARVLSRIVSPAAPHQSLPCVRGGGSPQGDSEGLSIPQSKIKDFCQLPLHKGAFSLLSYTAQHHRFYRW